MSLDNIMLNSGIGNWNPIVWLFAFVCVLIIVLILRLFGNKDYEKNTGQTKSFLSGNPMEVGDPVHAGDIYWGFKHALEKVYEPLKKIHTGMVNDYIGIYLIVLSLVLLVVLIW